ncbi:ethanolamine ammonia-lyase subunit EutC [Leptospira wolffii]|uniref:Ethanolamine ammonia-lyase small subunit n=1 Tax=Leptospira wolffii TaxID=409998 RepID=A0ABV5BMG3_9LEPT|nr:ethanolamine ammonia-lyase subunit EutC [Leptospira wolffii]TGL49051.1 ethanolamine ammonia-lyase subunit EutC [Leptospira wolffii]
MKSWDSWKKSTAARIGLDRSGGSVSTKEILRFRLDHARARDAVLLEPNYESLMFGLNKFADKSSDEPILLESLARNREEYLLRPDLGRRLSGPSLTKLRSYAKEFDLALVAVDGLSAKALDSNLLPFLEVLFPALIGAGLKLSPPILVKLGRVAIGDEIGEILKSKAIVLLIGERPGLTSADSLGMYLTFDPRLGKTDESRNCISNIRPDGMDFKSATEKILYLVKESLHRKISGVDLKDEMQPSFLENRVEKRIE